MSSHADRPTKYQIFKRNLAKETPEQPLAQDMLWDLSWSIGQREAAAMCAPGPTQDALAKQIALREFNEMYYTLPIH